MAAASNWKSRKFASQIIVLAIASAMLWFGKLDGDQWAALAAFVAGAYQVANVAHRKAETSDDA